MMSDASTEEAQSQDGSCLLWNLPPELVFHCTSFLDGKALSSFTTEALMMTASKNSTVANSSASLVLLLCYILRRWQDETLRLLVNLQSSHYPQPALVKFVQESLVPRTSDIKKSLLLLTSNNSYEINLGYGYSAVTNTAQLVKRCSEWCCLLDYILIGPRSSRNHNSTLNVSESGVLPDHMLWPIGVGVFTTSLGGNIPLQTKVILSSPVWDPIPILLCRNVWLPDEKTRQKNSSNTHAFYNHNSGNNSVGAPTNFSWLPSEGDIDGLLPDQNMVVVEPYDATNLRTFQATQALTLNDDFLSAMGRPDSCLSLLPDVDCPIYGSLLEHIMTRIPYREVPLASTSTSCTSSVNPCRSTWIWEEQCSRRRGSHSQTNNQKHLPPRMLGFFDYKGSQLGYLESDNIIRTNRATDYRENLNEELVDHIIYLMKALEGHSSQR